MIENDITNLTPEELKMRLSLAVDQFVEGFFGEKGKNENWFDVLAFGVVAEVEWIDEESGKEGSSAEMWFSNENRMFQRGFFTTLLDDLRLMT
jgi:hypothetical protein